MGVWDECEVAWESKGGKAWESKDSLFYPVGLNKRHHTSLEQEAVV